MSTHTPASDDLKVADLIARFIKSQGVQRVYGLCGGHIMPVWMAVTKPTNRDQLTAELVALDCRNVARYS